MISVRQTVFSRLKDELRRQIEDRELIPGAALPSENQLSDTYGISRPSVRKALDELENSGLIRRIPGKGSFVSSPSQPALRRLFNVGVDIRLDHEQAEWYTAKLLSGISRCCADNTARMVFVDAKASQPITPGFLDGFIIMTDAAMECGTQLAAADMPVVVINRFPEDPAMAYVSVDYPAEARRAVSHLIAMGHRDIALIYGMPGAAIDLRRLGYEQAMNEAGLHVTPGHIFTSNSLYNLEEPIAAFLERRNFSAAFAVDATMMFQLHYACKSRNISIPDDLSVICFDDMDTFSRQIGLGISEVKMPLEHMGELAAGHILARLSDPHSRKPMKKLIHADIVIRESCKIINRR